MKSIKEFIYLIKNLNIYYASYYLIYKVELKIYNSPINKNNRKKRSRRLEKIYEYLNLYKNNVETVKDKKLIAIYGFKGSETKTYLRPFSSDYQVYSQVIIQESYRPIIDIYNQLFKLPPSNLIDLGANIGLTSVYFASNFKNINIIAMEPFMENAEMAELNMISNNLINFRVICGGIWNKKTKLSIKRDFRDGKEWGISLVEDIHGEIEGYCLNEIINIYLQTDILKIDIEGTEKILFENEDYASEFLKKVKCIAIEIHDEFKCRELIYNTLNKNNFIYYDIQDMTIAINRKFI